MTTIRELRGVPSLPGELTDAAPVGSTIGDVGTRRTPIKVPAALHLPEFAALELERLWPHVWQLACTVDHVREPGDWYEYTCGPLSVVLVRGHDRALRAFQNVCLHRGNELCTGSGTGLDELRCGYHRWCWDLEGNLREVPSRKGFGALRNDDYPLHSVQVGTWGPLVFVNLDLDAGPLDEFLAPVPADAAWLHPDDLACTYMVTLPLPCNWKAAIDAFSETYHVQGIHRQMLASTDDVNSPQATWERHGKLGQPYGLPSPRLRDGATDQEIWESFVATQGERVGRSGREDAGPHPPIGDGETMRTVLARMMREKCAGEGVDLGAFTDEQVTDLHQYNCFPNISPVFLAESLSVIRTRPGTTPDDCFLDIVFCRRLPAGATDRGDRPTDVLLDAADADLGTVFNQDIANLRRVQRGMHQPGFTHLTLSQEERRIESLHRNLETYLGIEPSQISGGDAGGDSGVDSG